MGQVVGVALGEIGVERHRGTASNRLARAQELDDVLVIPQGARQRPVRRASRGRSPRSPTHARDDRRLDLLADQVFAEGRERVTRPAGEVEERRIERLEPNRVADHVGPQACAGGHDDRVVHARLDRAEPVARVGPANPARRPGRIRRRSRGRKPGEAAGSRVAEGDESLGARVDFLKPIAGEPRIVLERLAIGVELDAPVDDEFEPGPDLGDRVFAGQLEDALETRGATSPERR